VNYLLAKNNTKLAAQGQARRQWGMGLSATAGVFWAPLRIRISPKRAAMGLASTSALGVAGPRVDGVYRGLWWVGAVGGMGGVQRYSEYTHTRATALLGLGPNTKLELSLALAMPQESAQCALGRSMGFRKPCKRNLVDVQQHIGKTGEPPPPNTQEIIF